jgi:large subunit ribosomal protein L14
MIQKGTILYIIDNSGASIVKCIHVIKKGRNNLFSGVGNLIKVSVKRLRRSIPKKRVKKGEVLTALVVSTKKGVTRKNGLTVLNNYNHAVLLNKDLNNILSSRISSPIFLEVRRYGFSKLITIASLVI